MYDWIYVNRVNTLHQLRLVSPQQILTTVMTHITVDKSKDNAKSYSICFLPQFQRQRKCCFHSVTKSVTH